MKYLLIFIGFAVIVSLSFFTACDSNPTEADIDTLYIYDTLIVYDTVIVVDTLIQTLLDTFNIVDTVFVYDTTLISDSVVVTRQSIFHIPPASALAPSLMGYPHTRQIICTDIHPDSLRIEALVNGEPHTVIITGSGIYEVHYYGLSPDGNPLTEGTSIIEISVSDNYGTPLASFIDSVKIIHCGISAMRFEGSVEYLYHKSNPTNHEYIVIGDTLWHFVLGDGYDIYDEDGRLKRSPVPWWQGHYPPFYYLGFENYSLPAVYLMDEVPTVSAQINCDYPVKIHYAGQSSETATLRITDIDMSTAGRKLLTMDIGFSVQIQGQWIALPGFQRTEHILYALFGDPVLLDSRHYSGSPPHPWMAAIALASEWCHGLSDFQDATYAIRNAIYYDLGFYYRRGNYTSYDGSYYEWDRIHFYFADFLDQSRGVDLYCHDVACAFTTIAGCMGIDMPYYYLGWGFTTSRILGIGRDSWTVHNWTAHSVNSYDGGVTVYDACLNLDGTDDPTSPPHENLEVIAMPVEDYITRLTASSTPPQIRHSGYPYIY